jgi:hypothetical protein
VKKQKQSKRKFSKNRAAKRKQHSSKSHSNKRAVASEWVGGRFLAPFHIEEDAPYRPVMELWVELPSELVVHFEIHDPHTPIPPVTEGLRQALHDPTSGVRPRRLRLNDPDWASAVQHALPKFAVMAAPTPELQPVFDQMVSSMGETAEPVGYLEDGKLQAEKMGSLFKAADALYRLAPWQFTFDEQLIEVNIPELDVHGACISVIGALGESYGFLLFSSLEDYEQMLAASYEIEQGADKIDLGCSITSLNYERGADLPGNMRREVQQHGWPVAAATAYPVVEHRDHDGLPRGLIPRELRIMTACTEALVAALEVHADRFNNDEPLIFSVSYADKDSLEVHLQAPPEALMAYAGDTLSDLLDNPHRLDHVLMRRLLDFAHDHWGDRLMNRIDRLIGNDGEMLLMYHFGVYHLDVDSGKTVAECYLEQGTDVLEAWERLWLTAQQTAWLSLWEVIAVVPGESLELRDLLTDEVRHVQDSAAAESTPVHTTLLGRIVHYDGTNLLTGVHPRTLPPLAAAEVAERMRKYLHNQSAIPPERLREANTGRYLIRRWQDKIDQWYNASDLPFELHNTDGDPILGTVDRFTFDKSQYGLVEAKLLELDNLQPDSPGRFTFLREKKGDSHTVIGWAQLQAGTLRIESNSIERADALREQIETACASLIRHRGRIHEDALTALDHAPVSATGVSDIAPEQLDWIIQSHKQQHYENWLNEPIPALGNKTPRQAIRNKSGRAKVTALIKDIEYHEAALPAGQRFDVSILMRELKL